MEAGMDRAWLFSRQLPCCFAGNSDELYAGGGIFLGAFRN